MVNADGRRPRPASPRSPASFADLGIRGHSDRDRGAVGPPTSRTCTEPLVRARDPLDQIQPEHEAASTRVPPVWSSCARCERSRRFRPSSLRAGAWTDYAPSPRPSPRRADPRAPVARTRSSGPASRARLLASKLVIDLLPGRASRIPTHPTRLPVGSNTISRGDGGARMLADFAIVANLGETRSRCARSRSARRAGCARNSTILVDVMRLDSGRAPARDPGRPATPWRSPSVMSADAGSTTSSPRFKLDQRRS